MKRPLNARGRDHLTSFTNFWTRSLLKEVNSPIKIWFTDEGRNRLHRKYDTTLNGRRMGHVTQLRNLGTPSNS